MYNTENKNYSPILSNKDLNANGDNQTYVGGIQTSDLSETADLDQKTKENGTPCNLGMMAKNHKRHIIQHHYHDHANEAVDVDRSNTKKKLKRKVSDTFPVKLHDMLDEIEKDGLASIISWQSHGRAFVVHKPDDFVKYILPKYVCQSKFRSFQRQLNRYGFSWLFAGRDKGGYYHEMFLRGKTFLAEDIVMTKVKGTGVRGVSSPKTEPDFYSMLPVLPGLMTKSLQNGEEKSLTSNPDNLFDQDLDPVSVQLDFPCNKSFMDCLVGTLSSSEDGSIIHDYEALAHVNLNQEQISDQISMNVPVANDTGPIVREISKVFGHCSCNDLCALCAHSTNDGKGNLFCPDGHSVQFSYWVDMTFDDDENVCDDSMARFLDNKDIVPDDDPDFQDLLNQLVR